jgi:hypothetical protein
MAINAIDAAVKAIDAVTIGARSLACSSVSVEKKSAVLCTPLDNQDTIASPLQIMDACYRSSMAKEKQESKGDSVVIKYRDHAGSETSRTFSKEVHGDDFAELAAEFKATNASKIIE